MHPHDDDTKVFWCVWSPQGGPPTVKQPSYEIARAEAERLARKSPGSQFFILEAIGMREVTDMRRVDFDSRIPF